MLKLVREKAEEKEIIYEAVAGCNQCKIYSFQSCCS